MRLLPEKRIEAIVGQACLDCHRVKTPAIHADRKNSVHGKIGVDCAEYHCANNDVSILKSHLQHYKQPISIVVSPINCGGCHPKQAEAYKHSKHANTHEIMWQIDYRIKDGMNNAIERTSGCFACHGTVVQVNDGKPVAGTWPNVGVGRVNPEGSLGSCSSSHTRHRFSLVEARKPEACDQCHLGPDHPQIEIYNESEHGTIYHAEGDQWTWYPDTRQWQAGRHYRALTCAAIAALLMLATAAGAGGPTTIPDDRIVVCLLPLDHADAGQLAGVLAPLLSPAGTISADPAANMLVIKDRAGMVKKLIKAVKGKQELGECLNIQIE